MIRVGFDTSPQPEGDGPRSGLERVVEEVVDALEERGRLEVVRLAAPRGDGARAWRWRELPRAVARHGLVGLHSFTSAFALGGPGRRVQTVHEHPWLHGVRENAGARHRAWARLGPLRADAVLCPTEHVAAEQRRLAGGAKVRVCPWGVGAPFAPEPPAGVVDELLLGKLRLPEDPLLVCPGAVRPKKNLAALLRGLAAFRERGPQRVFAVVTGDPTPSLRRDLGLASRLGLTSLLLTPGPVAEDDLPALLRLASGVAVLSHSEGFGLPVLEGLACGAPALVPHGSAQAEVAGAAGIAVRPSDPDSVADGLTELLARREELRAAAEARAAELSWERCAERLEALWEELAA